MSYLLRFKSIISSGATLLALSAMGSKLLSFARDKLVLEKFSDASLVDAIYASFRVPDFFFFLFIASTISVIFIPRIEQTAPEERADYLSSFFWGIVVVFGFVCIVGALALPYLVPQLFDTLDPDIQNVIIELSRWLFLTSFLLALNALFSAYLQWKEKFWAVALAPILYMGGVVLGLLFLSDSMNFLAIPVGANIGIFINLIIFSQLISQKYGYLSFAWKKPAQAWDKFGGDFSRRVLAGSAFQINQTIDVIIAARLVSGAITAFSIGTALGHFLLSVIGYSTANALFPQLTKTQNFKEQWPIIRQGIKTILLITIPASIIAIFLARWGLATLFSLSGDRLWMTQIVFQLTVASLPMVSMIPLFSRSFLARNDTSTPLFINYLSLSVATALAAYLSLVVFSGAQAIIGLAVGNFVANTLGFILFALAYLKAYKQK